MRRSVRLLAAVALLNGCGGEPTTTGVTSAGSDVGPQGAANRATASRSADLDPLRRVTAPFRQFEKARAAGWSAQITPCMTDPAGGMGFHYGNPALIDGSVRIDEPELLLYEPQPGGRLRLVAVEYIVPLSAWTSPQPPRLYGRDFHVVPAFQVWALHVWLWQKNPGGLFTDWNPLVTCANTTDVATMAHH